MGQDEGDFRFLASQDSQEVMEVSECIASYGILCYLTVSNSIARYCVVGFGAQAVSRKMPIYLIYLSYHTLL